MVRLPTHRPPTHPGELLLEEFLRPLGITQVEFARAIGVPLQRVNEIVKRKRGVTPDTALRFEAALGARPPGTSGTRCIRPPRRTFAEFGDSTPREALGRRYP
jgi:addiction module HigA family antidote